MNVQRISTSFVLFVLSVLWIYRDSVGQLCDSLDAACVQSVAIPCSAGTGTCVAITQLTIVPGNNNTCTNITKASYYTANPPASWTDCSANSSFGSCSRTAGVCMVIYLYKN